MYYNHIAYAAIIPWGHMYQPVMASGTLTLTLNQREGIEGGFSLPSNLTPKLKSLYPII